MGGGGSKWSKCIFLNNWSPFKLLSGIWSNS